MNPSVPASLVLLALVNAAPVQPLEYTFERVKSKVVVTHDHLESRAAAGATALAGDGVRTGVWGKATLAVPERASRFEIYPSTKVLLAGPDPGVLVVLEKGRLRGIFDTLLGNEQRLVATPGALLAVRGTRYGVEVHGDGAAVLAVFEGTVEVIPRAPGAQVVPVQAGEMCVFGPGALPHRMPAPAGMSEHSWMSHGGMSGGMMREPTGSSKPRRQGGMGGHH